MQVKKSDLFFQFRNFNDVRFNFGLKITLPLNNYAIHYQIIIIRASLNINKNSKWFRDFFKGAFSVEDMVRVYKNLEPIIKSYGPNDYNLIMNSVIIEGQSDLEAKIEAYGIKISELKK